MVYKPPKLDSYGPSGEAIVSLGSASGANGKSIAMVQVQFTENDAKYRLLKKDCPEYVTKGKFWVQLAPDKKSIQSMRPISGQFSGRVTKFPAKEGEQPSWKTKTAQGKEGQYSYNYFMVVLTIDEPEKYKGMEVPLMLRYHFGSAQEEVEGVMREVAGLTNLKSKYTGQLEDFLMATGAFDKGPIPYSDNILPVLMKRILRKGAKLLFTMKEGWIASIVPPDVNESADWGEEKEEASKKETPKRETAPAKVEEGHDWGDPEETEVEDTEKSDGDDVPWDTVED